MSRSNKEEDRLVNPAIRFFEWSGKQGQLKWYDKETKENHFVDAPFTFLVLDQLNTATGYSDELGTGFWSNEVRRVSEKMNLRTKSGIYRSGIWKEDLSTIDGVRFTKSVYIAFYDDEKQLQIGNIKFSGSALGGLSDKAIEQNLKDFKAGKAEVYSDVFLTMIGWFNFTKASPDIEEVAVQLVGTVQDKKGSNDFFRPVFKRIEKVSPETNEKALELDRVLQTYLKSYFAQNAEPEQAQAASANGNDYIAQRNAELEDHQETDFEPVGSNDYRHKDPDIPF